MIISLRTFINTTFFWIFVLIGFWGYTKYDQRPAQEFINYIGRAEMGNLTITSEEEPLENKLILEKLSNIEQVCSQSVRLYMYDNTPIPPNPNFSVNPAIPTTPLDTNQTTSVSKKPLQSIPIIENSSILPSQN